MILDEYQAERMSLEIAKRHSISAVLASQSTETFLLCRGRINWLGGNPFTSAFVISETEEQRLRRRRRKQQEEIVLGVELLHDCRLEIDFAARAVSIARLS
jgi:hypothetical protein